MQCARRKVTELEGYQALEFIGDSQAVGEPQSKKGRMVKQVYLLCDMFPIFSLSTTKTLFVWFPFSISQMTFL